LERTVTKMHALEEQNQSFQTNYEQIKEELIETRKKYNEARENYMATAAAKLEVQRNSEAFIEKIKYQLAEKTKEFEQHRDKYTPQDIEYVRIQVQEDLEVAHKQKVQSLQAEIERQKDAYYACRRELERNKTEFETSSQGLQRETAILRDEYESTVTSLRRQVSDLQLRDYSPDKDDRLRTQRVRIHELEAANHTLEDEIASLRRERDDAVHAYEVSQSKYQESYAELRGKLVLNESDKHALEHRLSTQTAAVSALEAQLQSKRQASEEMERALRHTKQMLDDREHSLKSLKQSAADEMEAHVSTREAEYADLHGRIDALTARLSDREDMVRRSQRETAEMQLRAESLISEQRRSHAVQMLESRQRCDALEMEMMELRESHKASDSQHAQMLDQYIAESDRLKSELSRLQREKEVLHSQLRGAEQKVSTEKQRATELRRASEEAQRVLKGRITAIEAEQRAAENKLATSKELLKSLDEKNRSLQLDFDRQMDTLQAESEKRYEELGRTYRVKLEDMKNKVKKTVSRERKRGDAYKEHALSAHRKGKALTGAALALAGGDDEPVTSTAHF
jgi:chromosome segregation ATPase